MEDQRGQHYSQSLQLSLPCPPWPPSSSSPPSRSRQSSWPPLPRRARSPSQLAAGAKVTHLQLHFRDRYSGALATNVRVVAGPTKEPPTDPYFGHFGDLSVLDNVMTEGPSPASKLVGRAQAFIAQASKEEVASVLVGNPVFMEGPYKGSTLAVVGRKARNWPERDFVVVGGSGVFRFAQGYVVCKTHQHDPATGDAVMEMAVDVKHYRS